MFFFELLKAVIFGAVEGITEWLPISSTGHLILLDTVFGVKSDEFYNLFEVIIQLGAICAVATRFRKNLSPFGRSAEDRRRVIRLWQLIIIGTLPSAVIGFLFDDVIEELFYGPVTVAVALIFYGVLFILIERYRRGREPHVTDMSEMSFGRALSIGFFQTLALIPGTSRSGATILGAYLCGASRALATEFSFFLAIPTMAGAGALRSVKFFAEGNCLSPSEWAILAVGTLTAFLVSLAVVDILTDFARRHSFSGFGVYRIALGAVILIFFLTGRL